MPLREVAEQLALVVGHEAGLDPASRADLAFRVPRPRVISPFREIRGLGPSDIKNSQDNRCWSPRLKVSTKSITSPAIARGWQPSGSEGSSLVTSTFVAGSRAWPSATPAPPLVAGWSGREPPPEPSEPCSPPHPSTTSARSSTAKIAAFTRRPFPTFVLHRSAERLPTLHARAGPRTEAALSSETRSGIAGCY